MCLVFTSMCLCSALLPPLRTSCTSYRESCPVSSPGHPSCGQSHPPVAMVFPTSRMRNIPPGRSQLPVFHYWHPTAPHSFPMACQLGAPCSRRRPAPQQLPLRRSQSSYIRTAPLKRRWRRSSEAPCACWKSSLVACPTAASTLRSGRLEPTRTTFFPLTSSTCLSPWQVRP